MAKHPETPCSDCPYRKDAPLHLWDRYEFRKLLEQDESQFGTGVYACHKHKDLDPVDRGMCAGWAVDQKRRNIPSINLRLQLMGDPLFRAAFTKVHDGGHKLFKTIKAMCRANGVR